MQLSAHDGGVTGVAVARGGRWLATAGSDWIAKLWAIGDAEPTAVMHGLARPFGSGREFEWPRSRWLATGTGRLRGWDASTGTRLRQRRLGREDVLSVQFGSREREYPRGIRQRGCQTDVDH